MALALNNLKRVDMPLNKETKSNCKILKYFYLQCFHIQTRLQNCNEIKYNGRYMGIWFFKKFSFEFFKKFSFEFI